VNDACSCRTSGQSKSALCRWVRLAMRMIDRWWTRFERAYAGSAWSISTTRERRSLGYWGGPHSKKSPAEAGLQGGWRKRRKHIRFVARPLCYLFHPRPRPPLLPARLELGLGDPQRRYMIGGAHLSWLAGACSAQNHRRSRGPVRG
jgi:hypothetical protein